MISLFDLDVVCSFVAVPFFKDGKLERFFITYIKMKDNWHDSVNRYLLNEDDLQIYQLLIRELGHAIVRQESYDKIYRMNKQLQAAATTDVLTGITNRMGMYARVEELLEKRTQVEGLGIMFIDLDNFKPYNDTYGHENGDKVIINAAEMIKKYLNADVTSYRVGGDEFVVLVSSYAKEAFDEMVEMMKADGAGTLSDPNDEFFCRLAIGGAYREENEELQDTIKRAESMMYQDKHTVR